MISIAFFDGVLKINSNCISINANLWYSRTKFCDVTHIMNNAPLEEVTEIKDLGVIFDCKLSFVPHINAIVNKSYRMLGFIGRVTSKFNNISCIKFLYNSLVRSRLEYNSPIWNPHAVKYKAKIESVQRKYTRILQFRLKSFNEL